VDYSFFTTDTPLESISPISELILASPVNIYTPRDKALSYSTPLISYLNKDESKLPNSELNTIVASPTPFFTPSIDRGHLHYPTPPYFSVKELSRRQQSISLESGRLSAT
jgi:hypothetical protein